VRARLARALAKLGQDIARVGRIEGQAVKTLRGTAGDSFHRLRIGDYRVTYDVIDADRVVLVLGIVHRSDLERWIRDR
jgi:mRNA-degrading endonuclease RelE of RelBE toxin-antitoxin system